MRRPLLWLLPILLLTGCTRLDAIPAAPPQTAATWLTALRAESSPPAP